MVFYTGEIIYEFLKHLLSENSSQIAVGVMRGTKARCCISVQIITSLFFLLFLFLLFGVAGGSTHFFKGLGIEDFLKGFHGFRAFQPM